MQSKLDKLKSKLSDKDSKVTVNTEFYLLAKELGCLSDLLGREYDLVREQKEIEGHIKIWRWKFPIRWKHSEVVGFRQKPMTIPSFVNLMKEMEKDYKRQEKQMKESQRKGRRR